MRFFILYHNLLADQQSMMNKWLGPQQSMLCFYLMKQRRTV